MTNEPSERNGRNHSDAASRLAALLAEIESAEAAQEVERTRAMITADRGLPPSSEIVSVATTEQKERRPVGRAGLANPPPTLPAEPPEEIAPAAPLPAGPSKPVVEAADPAVATGIVEEPTQRIDVIGNAGGASSAPVPPMLATAASAGHAEMAVGTSAAVGHSLAEAPSGAAAGPASVSPVLVRAARADSLVDAPEKADRSGEVVPPAVRARSKVRAVSFGLAITLLAASVPVLGYVGSRLLLESRGGRVEGAPNDARAPGYVAVVEPTPTALVIQRNKADEPVALTVLALGNGDEGGSVLFVPLDTNLDRPAFLIDRLRTAYSNGKIKGNDAQLVKQVSRLLNIGFSAVVNLDDADWAQVVRPVAPLTIDNPVDLQSGGAATDNGKVEFPAGSLQLTADEVAAYLSATAPGEDDLDRLSRHKLVWEAWLKAIATSTSAEAVPNTLTGIGPFVTTLARGRTGIDTLAVLPAAQPVDGMPTFQIDPARMRTQVAEAVPSPTSPELGDRYSIRLLNGVDGDQIPDQIVGVLVAGGAQINAKGNASRFGHPTTRIEYHDPARKGTAMFVQRALGAGRVVADLSDTDTVDLVITLGSDVLDR